MRLEESLKNHITLSAKQAAATSPCLSPSIFSTNNIYPMYHSQSQLKQSSVGGSNNLIFILTIRTFCIMCTTNINKVLDGYLNFKNIYIRMEK